MKNYGKDNLYFLKKFNYNHNILNLEYNNIQFTQSYTKILIIHIISRLLTMWYLDINHIINIKIFFFLFIIVLIIYPIRSEIKERQ